MNRVILVVGVFTSLFFTGCEKETLENKETNEIELQLIDKGEIGDPGDDDFDG